MHPCNNIRKTWPITRVLWKWLVIETSGVETLIKLLSMEICCRADWGYDANFMSNHIFFGIGTVISH